MVVLATQEQAFLSEISTCVLQAPGTACARTETTVLPSTWSLQSNATDENGGFLIVVPS